MNHRIGRLVFGFAIGLIAAWLAYRSVIDADTRAERAMQEQAVTASRAGLEETLRLGKLEIVDPLAPDRVVGKAYVFPADDGWQVSGFYRRDSQDLWHPYLVTLDSSMTLLKIKVSDSALLARDGESGVLEVLP